MEKKIIYKFVLLMKIDKQEEIDEQAHLATLYRENNEENFKLACESNNIPKKNIIFHTLFEIFEIHILICENKEIFIDKISINDFNSTYKILKLILDFCRKKTRNTELTLYIDKKPVTIKVCKKCLENFCKKDIKDPELKLKPKFSTSVGSNLTKNILKNYVEISLNNNNINEFLLEYNEFADIDVFDIIFLLIKSLLEILNSLENKMLKTQKKHSINRKFPKI